MRCHAWIYTTKTKGGRIRKAAMGNAYPGNTGYTAPGTQKPDVNRRLCGGQIKVEVDVENSGSCSCCGYSEIVITYTCDYCGSKYHGNDLPRGEGDLQMLLQDWINAKPDHVPGVSEIHKQLAKSNERRRKSGV